MAIQFNERTVSTCEATGSQNTRVRARRSKAREQDKEKRKEKRYPEGRRVGCRWSLANSHNRENICAPRIAFAFCAWPHCPCRAARDTHRRRCPLPQGVEQAAAAARRQLRVASCEHGQKGAEAETRKSMYGHKTAVYLIGIMTPGLLRWGAADSCLIPLD